jgi:hypothetical protein
LTKLKKCAIFDFDNSRFGHEVFMKENEYLAPPGRKKKTYYKMPASFFDLIIKGRSYIWIDEINELAGKYVSPTQLISEMAKRGWEKNRNNKRKKFTKIVDYEVEPYRHPEDCPFGVLAQVMEAKNTRNIISWREVVCMLGFHPYRVQVDAHMSKLGYIWMKREHRWKKGE